MDNQWRMKMERADYEVDLAQGATRALTLRIASSRPRWSGCGTTPSPGQMRSGKNSTPTRRQTGCRYRRTEEGYPVAGTRPSVSLEITRYPGQGPQAHPPAPHQGYHH